MAAVRFEYDAVGDILHIESVAPYPGQEEDEIDDGVVARFNAKTGKLESFEILWFFERVKRDKSIEIPLDAFQLIDVEPAKP